MAEKSRNNTTMKAWAFLVLAVGAEVAATLSLKGALDNSALYVVVVIGYVIAFASLAKVLQLGLSLGVTYGVWAAGGVALTAIFSTVIFGEPMTLQMAIGIVIIIAGVICVELGAQVPDRRERERLKAATSINEIASGAKGGER